MRAFGINERCSSLPRCAGRCWLSLLAFIGGGIAGLLVALARTARRPGCAALPAGYIQVFQGTPLLIATVPGILRRQSVRANVAPITSAAIGADAERRSVLGEIWRGCIAGDVDGQWEAAIRTGMRHPAAHCAM